MVSLNKHLRGQAYDKLISLRLELGDFQGAMSDYNAALKNNPDDVEAYIRRGCIQIRLGEYLEATEDFKRAILIDPNWAKLYYDKIEEALENVEREDVKQQIIQNFMIRVGNAYYTAGNY